MSLTSRTVTTELVSPAEIQSASSRALPAPGGGSKHVVFSALTAAEYLQTEAIHEAGHAVVALAIGLPLESVTVASTAEDRMFLVFDGAPVGPAPINKGSLTTIAPFDMPGLYHHLAFLAAGEVAVRHWLRVNGKLDDDLGADSVYQALSDREQALPLVTPHGLSITAGHLAAESFLVEHWTKVARLAYWLRLRGTVTGESARALTGITARGGN